MAQQPVHHPDHPEAAATVTVEALHHQGHMNPLALPGAIHHHLLAVAAADTAVAVAAAEVPAAVAVAAAPEAVVAVAEPGNIIQLVYHPSSGGMRYLMPGFWNCYKKIKNIKYSKSKI